MEIRHACSPAETARFTTDELRKNFLVEQLFEAGRIRWTYTHYDRVMIGGASPQSGALRLETHPQLRSAFFLERREIGIINVGGAGKVTAGAEQFSLEKKGCVYVGKGIENVTFESEDPEDPALFYLLSAPSHQPYPTRRCTKEEASPLTVGAPETSNHRTIYKYIHKDGIQSSQLVMGLTTLHTGSVWNTMPAHVHDRRMEAYFYFDLPEDQRVLHLMGAPQETRLIWTRNHQALLSPPWSIHSGCGTSHYAFIWGMAGENKDYTDMDPVSIPDLR